MVIVSDDVQNIRDHALVGKPSREFYVKLSEIWSYPNPYPNRKLTFKSQKSWGGQPYFKIQRKLVFEVTENQQELFDPYGIHKEK